MLLLDEVGGEDGVGDDELEEGGFAGSRGMVGVGWGNEFEDWGIGDGEEVVEFGDAGEGVRFGGLVVVVVVAAFCVSIHLRWYNVDKSNGH